MQGREIDICSEGKKKEITPEETLGEPSLVCLEGNLKFGFILLKYKLSAQMTPPGSVRETLSGIS